MTNDQHMITLAAVHAALTTQVRDLLHVERLLDERLAGLETLLATIARALQHDEQEGTTHD